jgi:hypothetical protein
MLYELIIGGLIGLVFGVTLEKSKVMEASAIIGQFLFKRFIMLKVFIVAMIVSLIVLHGMHFFGFFSFKLKELNLFSNVLGGGLLGAGIALSGACPGTVFAQMGVGYKDSFFTFAGGLLAAYIYLLWGADMVTYLSPWTLGKMQLSDAIGIHPGLLGFGIILILIIFLMIIEKSFPWKDEVEKVIEETEG